jgi:UDP-GlcNAc:undecaprenyl-phosphate GlcNAc-1-phosphate transferase
MTLETLPRLSLLVLAWFTVDRTMPLLMEAARRLRLYDVPRGYKAHEAPVPFVGGVAIYAGFMVALFATLRFSSIEANRPLFAILLGGFFVMLVGLLDDLRPVHAVLKLAVLAAVTFLVSRFGVRVQLTGHPVPDTVLTILWVAGVTSAMNSLDNWDGVAGGVAAIGAFFTFLVAWHAEPTQYGASYFALALLGASLGFVGYNYPPARVFLGNNGAFLLGFLLASLMVLTGWSHADPLRASVVSCAILVVPLYDITLSTILRLTSGRVRGVVSAIVYCGRDHLAHRISRQFGLGKRATAWVLYALAMTGGGVGYVLSLPALGRWEYVAIVCASLVTLVAVGRALAAAPLEEEQREPSA